MCDSAKMEVYLNPVKYCKTPTGHPKGHPCCKIADYDDTAFGAGILTVHSWRAGPDCGKFYIHQVFMKFNTPEASSARSERLFSGGKLVLETKRNRLVLVMQTL